MNNRLLTRKEYFNYFNFHENGTGCGIEQELESGEYYLFAQVFLPQEYFIANNTDLKFNPFLRNQLEFAADKIQVKFELFGIGNVDDCEAFVFKPWVVNVENPILFQLLEDFHLFIPSTLFYNLITRLIFIDQLNQDDFKSIRVLQDISLDTFQLFGLNRVNIPKVITMEEIEITRINEVEKEEISKFYKVNCYEITTKLEKKYFDSLLNCWYRVTVEEELTRWFGLKKSIFTKTIGFLRLYKSINSFTGGISLEYVIDKNSRNKGYAKRAALSLINYCKKYSFALSIGAEITEDNEISRKVIKNLGFTELKSSSQQDDNFVLNLTEHLDNIENKFSKGTGQLSVMNSYSTKHKRYF